MTTLRKALTQAKCSVPCKIKSKNTVGADWPKISDEWEVRISAWDDFTIENLNASYGDILDQHIPEGELKVPNPNTALDPTKITKARDINRLIIWSDGVLGPTLEFARAKKGLETGTVLRRRIASIEAIGITPLVRDKKTGRRAKVDHLVELDHYRLPTLISGLGRPSSSFPARHLANGGIPSDEDMWPLRRLANLCYHSETRYGYIVTEEDLVACCFNADNPKSSLSIWSVAIMPVAWTKAGEGQLTTDLALWWLSMLAISGPENRRLVRPEHMTRINAWEEAHMDDGGNWVRRHKYSNVLEQTDEPPLPAYEPPLPGNLEGMDAVFMAEVGINANAHFDLPPAGHNAVFAGVSQNSDHFDFNVLPRPNNR